MIAAISLKLTPIFKPSNFLTHPSNYSKVGIWKAFFSTFLVSKVV
jgi:hypothetical protein